MSTELPSIRTKKQQPQQKPVAVVEDKSSMVDFFQVEAPLAAEPIGYLRKRHDVKLSAYQATNLRRLALGLGESGAKLIDGKFVESGTDAIKWLLENLAEPKSR